VATWLVIIFWCFPYDVTPAAEKPYDIQVQADVKIPMRDGIRLSANIFRPKADGRFPTILSRTPYGKGGTKNGQARFFAGRGYVFISQDCRGKGASEGAWVHS